jgi:hypothetical protein
MGNNHGWLRWMKRGCLIKMRDDLTEQDTIEMYGVCLPKEMMDELFDEVFELISEEEYLEREFAAEINKEDQKLCYNTAYVPSYDPEKMCVTTKANKIWWLTPMMIEMAEKLAPIVEEDIDVLFGTCE